MRHRKASEKNRSRKTFDELEYGVVAITSGMHKGRIGLYDDDESSSQGIVYFGNPLFASGYRQIPIKHLSPVTTADLLRRFEELFGIIGLKGRATGAKGALDADDHVELLTELSLIQECLADRIFDAQFTSSGEGHRVFISHASADKPFARLLAIDLAAAGHRPWLDEWEILAGESIPTRISEGVQEADYMVVVLSEIAAKSEWVEREWQSKYWEEVNSKRIAVIPVLLRPCEIPVLLKPKKYADFTSDHREGFEQLLLAISPSQKRKAKSRAIQS